jgi:hypothetical protein
MIYDLQHEEFDSEFASFVREFREQSRAVNPRIKTADIRHIAKADGRQRFVIFFNGVQFDYFDFSATEFCGPGSSPADLDDIGFQPFDFTPDEKPLES